MDVVMFMKISEPLENLNIEALLHRNLECLLLSDNLQSNAFDLGFCEWVRHIVQDGSEILLAIFHD